jgi:gamma-glutamylcyclotransferase (GGCT)/AIG2-like uncharacterized protein YtfP
MKLVFVYGTLKRGGANHRLLEGQAFAGPAQTAAGYVLYDLDGYPGMVADAGAPEGVSGEVWSVDDDCLAGLDVLEATAEGLYGREAVALREPFARERVEAYIYLRSVEGRTRLGSAWTG